MGTRSSEGGSDMGARIEHPSVDERKTLGKSSRTQVPLSSHSGWTPATDRPDPVALLEQQNATREPDLVPVRHGGCWSRPSRSTGGRPRSCPPISRTPPEQG